MLQEFLSLDRDMKLAFCIRNYGVIVDRREALRTALVHLGLTSRLLPGIEDPEDRLVEVSPEKARKIVADILHKDLAYDLMIMPSSKADYYSHELCRLISGQNPVYYTNIELTCGDLRPDPITPFTLATFDAGILAISDKLAACVWVEDED